MKDDCVGLALSTSDCILLSNNMYLNWTRIFCSDYTTLLVIITDDILREGGLRFNICGLGPSCIIVMLLWKIFSSMFHEVLLFLVTTTTVLQPFVRDYPGEPVPEETFTRLHLS